MEKTTIDIFEEISSDTLQDFLQKTDNLVDGSEVEIRIASYGGEIFPTLSIIDSLKRFHTTANIIGFACSSAAILALSCDTVEMSENASLMLHSAWADGLDENDPGIIRCNELQEKIIKERNANINMSIILDRDIWLSAEQALKLNLADNIYYLSTINYAARCIKYVAKLKGNFMSEKDMGQEFLFNL